MNMNKIVVIATGGTIASRKNPETQKMSSGVITGDELLGLIPDLDPALDVEVQNIFGVPSSYLGPDKMLVLAQKIKENLSCPDVKGIVVTHGTDTLEETVYLSDLVIKNSKPVVFTGSQRGPLELGSDGIRNLKDAIRVADCDASRDKGVVLVFNEEIHSAARVIKTDAYKLESFRSEGTGPIGFIDEDSVQYHCIPIQPDHFPVTDIKARIDLIKAYAGMDGSLVEAAIQNHADGIVIEGFGRGHIPPRAMPAIHKAIAAGVVVLITSRCVKGFVREVYDFDGGTRDLLNAGAIAGTGLPGTKARIKLIIVLSHTRDRAEIAACFNTGPSITHRRKPC